MNLTVPFRAQLEALPGGTWVSQSLSQFSTAVSAIFTVQHADDGSHTTITATGPITERRRSKPLGEWIDVPFDATAFTVSQAGGVNTWTVAAPGVGASLAPLSYMLVGTTMFFNICVINSSMTIAGTPNFAFVRLPSPYRVAGLPLGTSFTGRIHGSFAHALNNGTLRASMLQALPNDAVLTLDFGANFVTGGFDLVAQVFFEVAS